MLCKVRVVYVDGTLVVTRHVTAPYKLAYNEHYYYHRRRTHRGSASFAPLLLKVPGQAYLFARVLFELVVIFLLSGLVRQTVDAREVVDVSTCCVV